MLPHLPVDDVAYVSSAHAKFASQRALGNASGSEPGAYFNDLIDRKLSKPVFLSAWCSALLLAVRHIGNLRSKYQMLGVATRRIIAGVEHVESRSYRPVDARIRVSMSIDRNSLSAEMPVSCGCSAGHPGPTCIRPTSHINPLEQSFLRKDWGGSAATKGYSLFSHALAPVVSL